MNPEQLRQKNIRKSQDIKNRNIAYFNSVNAAIEIISAKWKCGEVVDRNDLVEWRDWFFSEWEKWQDAEGKQSNNGATQELPL